MEIKTEIILGDCLEKTKELDDNSIDLIFSSPPYADQRKATPTQTNVKCTFIGIFYE